MATLVKSISVVSNYKFYNDDEEYFLTFYTKSNNGTLLNYTNVHNVDNITSGILGNKINKYLDIEPMTLINFYKYTKSQRKLTLLFTTFITDDIKSNKIVLNGIQKHVILAKAITINDFSLEMFMTDLVTMDTNKLVINISCSNEEDEETEYVMNKHNKKSFDHIIISSNNLSSPVLHNKMNILFEEVVKYKHKLNVKKMDNTLHQNCFMSPITGSLQFFNNKHKTWLNNGSKRINIPTLIKMNIENFEQGNSFIGVNKTNHVYVPFDGSINRIIKYNNLTIFRVINDYYISDRDKSKFQWNYAQDNSLFINRENPAILAQQNNYTLEYHIIVFGQIEFGNNILKSIYSTLKPNESYKVGPIFLQKGKYLLKVTNGNNVYVCTNRKIADIDETSNIKKFYEIHEKIGEII